MARSRSTQANAHPENTIEPSALRQQAPVQPPTEPGLRPDRAKEKGNHVGPENGAAGAPKPATSGPVKTPEAAPNDTTTVPPAVRDRFMNIREKYFFPNGDPAFQDLGGKLTTKSENAEVVRSLVEIAQARGWEEITVGGTKEFKRAVWHEATLHKIAVRGYTPTEVDEARVVHAMARRVERSRESDPAEPPQSFTAGRSKDSRARRESADPPSGEDTRSRDKTFRGELVDHGAENYKFNPNEDMSYFVKLRTDSGHVIELWGKDFERALKESKSAPKVGDHVEVRYSGTKTVTVPKKERDGQGNVVREYDLRTHRNAWSIETAAFLEERARFAEIVRDPGIDPREAARKNPQLAGTLADLRAAELVGHHRFPGDERARKRFVDAVRLGLAEQIRRGEPLPAPLMRGRSRTKERVAAREPATPDNLPLV